MDVGLAQALALIALCSTIAANVSMGLSLHRMSAEATDKA